MCGHALTVWREPGSEGVACFEINKQIENNILNEVTSFKIPLKLILV